MILISYENKSIISLKFFWLHISPFQKAFKSEAACNLPPATFGVNKELQGENIKMLPYGKILDNMKTTDEKARKCTVEGV